MRAVFLFTSIFYTYNYRLSILFTYYFRFFECITSVSNYTKSLFCIIRRLKRVQIMPGCSRPDRVPVGENRG
nr:MAG TPA: hypothetical protein [Caudoviricetes sp.]